MHDGEGKGRLVTDQEKEFIPIQGQEPGMVGAGDGAGAAGSVVHQRHFSEKLPRFHGGDDNSTFRGFLDKLHRAGVDDVHLIAIAAFFEDNLRSAKFPGHLLKIWIFEHFQPVNFPLAEIMRQFIRFRLESVLGVSFSELNPKTAPFSLNNHPYEQIIPQTSLQNQLLMWRIY